MRQLPLPFSSETPKSEPRVATLLHEEPLLDGASLGLAAHLTSLLREPVEVELTDNAWTMVSYRRVQGRLRFRLHHMFARAHEPVSPGATAPPTAASSTSTCGSTASSSARPRRASKLL